MFSFSHVHFIYGYSGVAVGQKRPIGYLAHDSLSMALAVNEYVNIFCPTMFRPSDKAPSQVVYTLGYKFRARTRRHNEDVPTAFSGYIGTFSGLTL